MRWGSMGKMPEEVGKGQRELDWEGKEWSEGMMVLERDAREEG